MRFKLSAFLVLASFAAFAQPWIYSSGTSGPIYYNSNVGIGVTPAAINKLHVLGRVNVDNEGIYATGDKGSVILAAHTGYYARPTIYSITPAGAVNDLLLNPAGGNVGIGTQTPMEKLEVNGRVLSRMTNGGGWDAVFGADSGNGLVVGKLGGNTAAMANLAHVLYRNESGAIYRGYNGTGVNSVTINSQDNGNTYFDTGGNVGIGTSSPQHKLHIAGRVVAQNEGLYASGDKGSIIMASHTGYYAKPSIYSITTTGTVNDLLINPAGGNVGIGTTTPSQKLTVKGTVYSTEVKVDVNAGTGPDYVFEPTYNLPTLAETEAYIKANKHLPEVPSAKEMEANGINLSEMNMLLLKKVEELTLHLIEQQKQITQQQKDLADQRRKMEALILKVAEK